jgi:hypothetical protein
VTLQLHDLWSDALEALHPEDQSPWMVTMWVVRVPTPTLPLDTPRGIALSDSEKAEALAGSLEAQFQPVDDPSDPAVTETVDVALRAYSYEHASEPILTDPAEVQHASGVSQSARPQALTASRIVPSSTFPSG